MPKRPRRFPTSTEGIPPGAAGSDASYQVPRESSGGATSVSVAADVGTLTFLGFDAGVAVRAAADVGALGQQALDAAPAMRAPGDVAGLAIAGLDAGPRVLLGAEVASLATAAVDGVAHLALPADVASTQASALDAELGAAAAGDVGGVQFVGVDAGVQVQEPPTTPAPSGGGGPLSREDIRAPKSARVAGVAPTLRLAAFDAGVDVTVSSEPIARPQARVLVVRPMPTRSDVGAHAAELGVEAAAGVPSIAVSGTLAATLFVAYNATPAIGGPPPPRDRARLERMAMREARTGARGRERREFLEERERRRRRV